ncbi:heavy-metal-associated domain-containing protein [Micromonospora sp. NPDC048999]|uniref:heavy-metal-associated domain-containing protein n=1 Tax=Micromonospora sp. NPDC048999 TaxID=3155391 RepID=UPI0033DA3099
MVERNDPTVAAAASTRVVTVVLPPGICRRCVRAVSRRVSDLPGVVSLEFDADVGVLRVGGEVDPAALRRAGLVVCPAGPACRRCG